MSEAVTNPAAPEVATEAPLSFEQKLEQKLFGPEPTEAPQEAAPEPSPEETSDEPLIDTEPEEQEAAPTEFELSHNGQKLRVSQEEARNLAQMGYDYTQKTQKLAEDYRRVQGMAKALEAQATLQPQFLEAVAEAKAIERQMSAYQKVDWVALASQDPMEYSKHRAQYDVLKESYQSAVQKAGAVNQEVSRAKQQVDQQQLAIEMQRLQEKVPEWRDPAKYAKESQEILGSLLKNEGFTQDDLSAWSALFADHRVINLMRKAYKYDQAVANSKAKKSSLQSLPQVPKPGARATAPSESQKTGEIVKQLHQAKDPERKKTLFDAALQAKMKRLGAL